MNFVVGSGPSGIMVSRALLSAGYEVTMLDAGSALEPERQEILDQMKHCPMEEWNIEDLKRIKEGMNSTTKGISVKKIYGSDFPYRDVDTFVPIKKQQGVEITSSLACGGLSTVWGAAVLPYCADDIESWPLGISDLVEHYKSVLSVMPLSAREDGLASHFPLYTEHFSPLDPSKQASNLLTHMSKHREPLSQEGIDFGVSRLAVQSRENNRLPQCSYCGLCMYGCPYGLIYSSAFALGQFLRNPKFSYRKDVIVERLTEKGDGVCIEALDRTTRKALSFEGSRIFLACGTLATTRVLLHSMGAYERPIQLLDSQHFLVPLLQYQRAARVDRERLHTMAQVFMEMMDEQISAHRIHFQIYSYNDLFSQAVKRGLGFIHPLFAPLATNVLGRTLVMMGYLHSDESPTMTAWLSRPGRDSRSELHLSSSPAGTSHKTIIRKALKKLRRNRRYLRAVPVSGMVHLSPQGKGFHCGGTFPMSRTPGEFKSDVLGRPFGYSRVHAVDSTVFPSIPSGPITFSVMANAHRIGTGISSL